MTDPGYYPYPLEPGTQRYWNGETWTPSKAESLDEKIASAIKGGYRVESRSEAQAVMIRGKRPNHILHLLLTIFTLGLWAIVWIVLAIGMHEHRIVIKA